VAAAVGEGSRRRSVTDRAAGHVHQLIQQLAAFGDVSDGGEPLAVVERAPHKSSTGELPDGLLSLPMPSRRDFVADLAKRSSWETLGIHSRADEWWTFPSMGKIFKET
jgi:hypothetical protein